LPTLVDTSVWVDLFRGNSAPAVDRLKDLIGREVLLLGDLILAEILQGVRTEEEGGRVDSAFEGYPIVALVGETIARRSAHHYRRLRHEGITVPKTIDCLIATWCIEHRVPLLHNDRDFHPFFRLGLVEA
jgi:predicted nucleic acid-binding protein